MSPRPKVLKGSTVKNKTGCGTLYTTINEDENGKPIEVFCRLGKAGGCGSALTETLGRLITTGLRNGTPIESLVKQLQGVSCHQVSIGVSSCVDAVAKALKEVCDKDKLEPTLNLGNAGACPECGGALTAESGCATCHSCGYSKCS